MMKPSDPTNTDTGTLKTQPDLIVWRKLEDLAVHPLAAKMPMLPEDALEMVALLASIELHGLDRQPLIIDPHDRLMDGRHRKLMAKRAGIGDVPCIVRPEEEAPSIIVESLVGRRHYTKGARAYLAAPLLVAAAEANKEARTQQLLAGANPRKPIQSVFGNNEEGFAAQLGFSGDLARQAKDIHKKFAAADERLAKWRDKFPDLVKQIGGPGKESGYPVPEWAQPVPENLRNRFEPKILSGDLGLGAVIQAIAGLEATKGQPRAEQREFALIMEGFKTMRLRVARWDKLSPEEEAQAAAEAAGVFDALPEAVRQQIILRKTASR